MPNRTPEPEMITTCRAIKAAIQEAQSDLLMARNPRAVGVNLSEAIRMLDAVLTRSLPPEKPEEPEERPHR